MVSRPNSIQIATRDGVGFWIRKCVKGIDPLYVWSAAIGLLAALVLIAIARVMAKGSLW